MMRAFVRLTRLRIRIPDKQWREIIYQRRLPFENFQLLSDNSILIISIGLRLPDSSNARSILRSYTYLVDLVSNTNASALWNAEIEELEVGYQEQKYPVGCAEEVYILHELLVKGDYNLYLDAEKVLLDVGVNVGYTSIYLAAQNPSLRIVGYEPVEVNYLKAKRNLSFNPHLAARITINNFGLSDFTGAAKMQSEIENRGRSSTVINRKVNPLSRVTELTVQVKNASDVVEQVLKDAPGMKLWIKLDCEGSEYQIIENLSRSGALSKIEGMLFEWHAIESTPACLDGVVKTLKSYDFCVYMQRSSDRSAETGLCLAARYMA